MDKKRAKEIAIKEWSGILRLMKAMKDRGVAEMDRDKGVDSIKREVLRSLFCKSFITKEEWELLLSHNDCALCAFFQPRFGDNTRCAQCPLYKDGKDCEDPGQPFAVLAFEWDGLSIDACLEAVRSILKSIKAWNVEE